VSGAAPPLTPPEEFPTVREIAAGLRRLLDDGSIAAAIVQVRWGATGLPLSATDGAIHRAPVVPPVPVAG
jgi:hypothetical protein